jgi:hypothetical protein
MVADGILASVVFVRPKSQIGLDAVTPQTLAQLTLRTLFHISFVVSQLGGVTATATGDDHGFKELRRVFYLAIDVLSSDEPSNGHASHVCENFVEGLVSDLRGSSKFFSLPILFTWSNHTPTTAGTGKVQSTTHVFSQAKTAYALACIEQLVPLLGARCLRDHVWGICVP